jgi:hypothetical protein
LYFSLHLRQRSPVFGKLICPNAKAMPVELLSVVYPTRTLAKMTGLPDELTETPARGFAWTYWLTFLGPYG